MNRIRVTTVVHIEGDQHIYGEYYVSHPTDIFLKPGEKIALASNRSPDVVEITGSTPEITPLASKK